MPSAPSCPVTPQRRPRRGGQPHRRARVAVLLCLSLGLSACAGVGHQQGPAASGAQQYSAPPSGSLTIMGFGGEDEVATARIGLFEKDFPSVKVTHNKGSFDAQQFLTALASGNPPDLVYMDRNLVGTYAAQGAIQPLTDCVSQQKIDLQQYRPSAVRSVTLGGRVWGIPEFTTATVNLVDTTSVHQAGLQVSDIQTKDWDALQRTAARLTSLSGGRLSRIGYDTKVPDSFPLWALANGAQLVKEDGAPDLADPKAVQALDFLLTMTKEQGGWTSYKSYRDSFDIFGAGNPLTTHHLGAMPMDSWYVNVLTDFRGKGLTLDSTPVTDHVGRTVSTLGGSAWAIPKGSRNPAAACAWARTMTSTEAWMAAAAARQRKVAGDKGLFTGLFTANTEADKAIRAEYVKPTGDAGFDHAIANVYQALDDGTALLPSPAGAEIDAAWRSAVSRALSGEQTAQAALDQAQSEASSAFAKAPKP